MPILQPLSSCSKICLNQKISARLEHLSVHERRFMTTIDDRAKDGGEEFSTKMHCIF